MRSTALVTGSSQHQRDDETGRRSGDAKFPGPQRPNFADEVKVVVSVDDSNVMMHRGNGDEEVG